MSMFPERTGTVTESVCGLAESILREAIYTIYLYYIYISTSTKILSKQAKRTR